MTPNSTEFSSRDTLQLRTGDGWLLTCDRHHLLHLLPTDDDSNLIFGVLNDIPSARCPKSARQYDVLHYNPQASPTSWRTTTPGAADVRPAATPTTPSRTPSSPESAPATQPPERHVPLPITAEPTYAPVAPPCSKVIVGQYDTHRISLMIAVTNEMRGQSGIYLNPKLPCSSVYFQMIRVALSASLGTSERHGLLHCR